LVIGKIEQTFFDCKIMNRIGL